MPDLFLVRFKGFRRGYYYNTYYHSLSTGVRVIVEAERGEDLGTISSKLMNENSISLEEKPFSILRPASSDDFAVYDKNTADEPSAMEKCAELVAKHNLPMKLVDTEYQHDRNKLTFYFTADHRVDFRALVRDLAAVFKTRIELRQIGVRDAARRIGGLGICGLVQCCCSFIDKFDPISTQLAREQNLSLNPAKISGNCGRLLCCLMYEMEQYREIIEKFPQQGELFVTAKGEGVVESINIFDKHMVVRYPDGDMDKITLNELGIKDQEKTSFFKNWQV